MQLLRRDAVCEMLQVSPPTLYRLVRSGSCPAPIRIGPRASRWIESEVDEFLRNRPRGTEAPAR